MRALAGLIRGTLPQSPHLSYEPFRARLATSTAAIWFLSRSVATLQSKDATLTLVVAWQCMTSRRQPMHKKAIISTTNRQITSAMGRLPKKVTSRWEGMKANPVPPTAATTLTTLPSTPSIPLRYLSATNCPHQSFAVDDHNRPGMGTLQPLLQEYRNDPKPADARPRTDLTRSLQTMSTPYAYLRRAAHFHALSLSTAARLASATRTNGRDMSPRNICA